MSIMVLLFYFNKMPPSHLETPGTIIRAIHTRDDDEAHRGASRCVEVRRGVEASSFLYVYMLTDDAAIASRRRGVEAASSIASSNSVESSVEHQRRGVEAGAQLTMQYTPLDQKRNVV